jgi:pullulanase/glycogen debranching enzyme
MYKAPENASLADRVRMNNLGLALVMLGQGIPFFHAGDDLLRSKSGDRNSYNSGDWFNRLDWSYQANNWAVGLPMESENANRYSYLRPLLANTALWPKPADIQGATAYFQELLKIRKSSALFRLRTAQDVQARLSFPASLNQVPGLIVMVLNGTPALDTYKRILVVFNAAASESKSSETSLQGNWQLHPVQAASSDPMTRNSNYKSGVFTVPARTAAVFVEE